MTPNKDMPWMVGHAIPADITPKDFWQLQTNECPNRQGVRCSANGMLCCAESCAPMFLARNGLLLYKLKAGDDDEPD